MMQNVIFKVVVGMHANALPMCMLPATTLYALSLSNLVTVLQIAINSAAATFP